MPIIIIVMEIKQFVKSFIQKYQIQTSSIGLISGTILKKYLDSEKFEQERGSSRIWALYILYVLMTLYF